MARTNSPLIWDHWRKVEGAGALGGAVHYYDEASQSLYLTGGGLSTQVAEVPAGHWAEAAPGAPIGITSDSFISLRLDHPANGTLYGVATAGTDLVFLRYVYAMDLSVITQSCNWTSQVDNAVTQLSATVSNVGAEIFTSETTLFQPGSRIRFQVRIGDSQPYPIGVAWVDEVQYDVRSDTVPISGRNTIGFRLGDQTFDDDNSFTGLSHEQAAAILQMAGIPKYSVQPGTGEHPFSFKPEDTLLKGLEEMMTFYTTSDKAWQLVELPDGTVLLGYDYWIAAQQPNSYYSFQVGRDLFHRKTKKALDATYTRVRVTGQDAAGADLEPCLVEVTNFPYWELGRHRTKHLTAPKGMTQEELAAWAQAQAEALQYVGIGEDFTGPFRPQLLVGDVAEVVEPGGVTGTALGLVTEVKHTFGRSDGFKTDFSVDSGGVVTDGENYIVYSRAVSVNGYNRRQRIVDMIRSIFMGRR